MCMNLSLKLKGVKLISYINIFVNRMSWDEKDMNEETMTVMDQVMR